MANTMNNDINYWVKDSSIRALLTYHFRECNHCDTQHYKGSVFRGIFSAAADDIEQNITIAKTSASEEYKLCYSIDRIKSELTHAYKQNDDFWWMLGGDPLSEDFNEYNSEDAFYESYYISAVSVWIERYLPEHVYDRIDSSANEYHPEMLKLLIKKYIWQPLFPHELAPYQEPASGLLPSLQQLLPTDGRSLALNDCHGWIQRLAP